MRCVSTIDMLSLSSGSLCAGTSTPSDVCLGTSRHATNGRELSPSLSADICRPTTPGAVTGNSVLDNHVLLPDRYQNMLAKRRHQPPDVSPSADLTAREKDLGQALAWIRQEMIQMKEQDKSLLKQFIDLRASILQLRCLYHYHGSTSDVNSLQGSTMSLNEARKSPRLLHIARADSDMAVATSSLKATSLPNSPQLFRFKWRSDELM